MLSHWNTASGFRSRKAVSELRSESSPRRRFSEAVLSDDRLPASGFFAKTVRWRGLLALLLLITVFLPIVHFINWTSTAPHPISSNDFTDDVSSLSFVKEDGKHQAVVQESLDDVKEPLGIVYADNSSNPDDESASSLLGQEFSPEKSGTYKHRDLSLEKEGKNEEVFTIQNGNEGLQQPSLVKEDKKRGPKWNTKTRPLDRKDGSNQRPSSVQSERTFSMVEMPKHQPAISDAQLQQLKNQLVKGKVYLELGALQNHRHFLRELNARVRDVERVLHGASNDSELPKDAHERLKEIEESLSKGKQILEDCVTTEKRLQATIRIKEEQLRAETKKTLLLTQLAAKTLPKSLHCLPLMLSIEYYSLNSTQQRNFPNQEKLEDTHLFHYALFSDNVLAVAVAVNSTVFHAKNPRDHVFHIVTDKLNYGAMRMWFLANPPGKATIQVQKFEEFTWLNSSYIPVLKQLESQSTIDYYFRTRGARADANLKYRNPKYLSILNHLRFYLPEIFPKLNKVVFLDDDIVVQKDLTGLWGIDLKGKVHGAIETCGESFHRFDKYLNFSSSLISRNFDRHACGWAYGMNVFDLVEWRKQNITEVYHSWQKLNNDRLLWRLGSLPPGLIAFYNHTLPLDRSWHLLGLGYDENVKQEDIDQAAVIHYNGNMKPWLEIGMAKYRGYWSRFVDYNQTHIRECNIIP